MTKYEWQQLWNWCTRVGSYQKFWTFLSMWVMGAATFVFVFRGLFDKAPPESTAEVDWNPGAAEWVLETLWWPALVLFIAATVPLTPNNGLLKARQARTLRAQRKERELLARETRLIELEAENARLDKLLEREGVTL